jgi:hypothetical protein
MKLTENQIRKVESDVNSLRIEIQRQISLRIEGKDNHEELSQANSNYHNHIDTTKFLWSKEFRDNLRSSDKDSIANTILYLEVDPWYFRSGYLKEHLLLSLKNSHLSYRNRNRISECFKTSIENKKTSRVLRYYFPLMTRLYTHDQLSIFLDELNAPSIPAIEYFKDYMVKYYASNKQAISNLSSTQQ